MSAIGISREENNASRAKVDSFSTGTPQIKAFWILLALTVVFLAMALPLRVRANGVLVLTFCGVSGVLLAWQMYLWIYARQPLQIKVVAIKSHYVQASVQAAVFAYWGWYWRNAYLEIPLVIAQVVFLYILNGLLAWSRGRTWQLGFGPLPIIFGTSLFMWFKDDWFVFQFLMVATGAFGKEFIKWRRAGRETHIFNPSALGLTIFSLILIFTGTTHYTWGEEIAVTLGAPHYIYLEIFLLGLIVQYLFSVTLMTFSAAAALCMLNFIYTGVTGVYHFVDSNIPIAVFLGLHLLMTDPSTAPRSDLGKVIFGGLYGLGVFVAYGILAHFGAPRFYDKLLIVPFLNMSVRMIERITDFGIIGRFTRWQASIGARRLNLVYMSGWVALFGLLLTTGFVQAPHPGTSIAFWKRAVDEGRPRARENLINMLEYESEQGHGEAANELGLLYIEGKRIPSNPALAAHFFARASQIGYLGGCANMAIQYLFYGLAQSEADITRAFDQLEHACLNKPDGNYCYLVGFAYEKGRGRPLDKKRARDFYSQGSRLGDAASARNLARMQLSGEGGPRDDEGGVRSLEQGCDAGDAECCLHLAFAYHQGAGVQRDERHALELLEKACNLGSAQACEALKTFRK